MFDSTEPPELVRDARLFSAGRPDDGEPPHGWNRLAATVERLRDQVRQANAEADGRALIEMAKGVLVERLRCSPADAARQLGDLAARAGLVELELAAELVGQAAQDRLTAATGRFLADSGRLEEVGRPEEVGDEHAPSPAVRLRTAESAVLAASDTQRVAQSLLDHALAPLGAVAVAVWSAGIDSSLSLAGFAGIAEEEARRWHYVPPGVATPARQALVDRAPLWIEDLSRSGLPSIGHRTLPGGRVVVPAGAGGRVLGALEICWPQELPPQPPQIQRQVEALAELCAHTLETGGVGAPEAVGADRALSELVNLAEGLLDPALVLRPLLDDDGELVDFRVHHVNSHFVDLAGRPRGAVLGAPLLEAYPSAATPGQLFEKIERVYATGEAFHAERMPLVTLVDQVPLTVVAMVGVSRHGENVLLVWRVEDETARLANLLQHAQRLGRIGGFEENTATGEITWNDPLFALYGLEPTADPVPLTRLAAHAHPDDAVPINRFLRTVLHHGRAASTTFRLRRSDGVTRHIRVIAEPMLDRDGHLLLIRGAYQDISAQHWTEVALSATRDQLAHTEQRVAEQNRLALQLQQAIMPPAQPPIDAFGLRIAVRYRPAEQEHLVGGDWYDAVVLPSQQVLVSVGDITGHGLEGATRMVVLRNALRGLAVTGASPGQLLSWLNLVAHHLNDNILATAVCALYDPRTRVLRWARAGHLPPILVRGRRATSLRLLSGVMLGVCAESEYEEGEIQLEHDDVLLLYTDGLVERRGLPLDDCIAWLRTTAAESAAPLEERLDHLLTHSPSDTDDDTCVVGIQLT
ncbi:SpoIIE family protein phosphatase [Streptoalloteichus hindustanus]|uniref:ANTAR domain-containing protein n=1 Tax=Streptoalloteichus hindustanus TaxID=2017 RepID=A0A1M5MZ00_STRHI|nr:SpoIIE family protein phosphatase [Streptoalloteichus hindustanus]SHG82457.1 ANTAR domain-containing protein [Streptoalloteichus hindustanus]